MSEPSNIAVLPSGPPITVIVKFQPLANGTMQFSIGGQVADGSWDVHPLACISIVSKVIAGYMEAQLAEMQKHQVVLATEGMVPQ